MKIKDILAYQEDINTHYMGEKITVEQDHILAEIFYKKIPTNCPLADDFKQRTLEHLANKNTKFDAVFSACYRLRVLLAKFRELRRKASTYAPITYAYRQKVACNGCGMTNHSTSDCFWEGHPLHNNTHKTWYNSEKGVAFRYAGQTYLRLGVKIPGYCAATQEDLNNAKEAKRSNRPYIHVHDNSLRPGKIQKTGYLGKNPRPYNCNNNNNTNSSYTPKDTDNKRESPLATMYAPIIHYSQYLNTYLFTYRYSIRRRR
jgi:hypothetical protein